MPNISPITLVIAIETLDTAIDQLLKEIEELPEESEELADLEELYLSWWKAAQELKRTYIEVWQPDSNMRPYEEIAKHSA